MGRVSVFVGSLGPNTRHRGVGGPLDPNGGDSRPKPLLHPFRALLVVALIVSPSGIRAAGEPGVNEGRARVAEFLSRTKTLSAGFRQRLLDAEQNLLEASEGSVQIKRPGRFRWDYLAPYEQIIVADGKRLWMHDVELEQITVKRIDEGLSRTPAMLLSGGEDFTASFDIDRVHRTAGLFWVRLVPRSGSGDFQSVHLGFDEDNLIRMELIDNLDQITRIEFLNVVRNPSIGDETFVFTPPVGVDVIGDADTDS